MGKRKKNGEPGTIGDRLRMLRQAKINPRTGKPYTLEAAARAMDIPYTSLAQYERNKRVPHAVNLRKLAEFYGTSVDFILGIKSKGVSDDIILKEILRKKGLSDSDVQFIFDLIRFRTGAFEGGRKDARGAPRGSADGGEVHP